MPEVQRSDSLRSADEGEAGDLPTEVQSSLIVETHVTSSKPPERSVSFNRDVHVKRIGRGVPRVTAALAGDGEGRLIATPVHKESITSRSKEDLALEAALVLEQVGNVNCVARDNRRLPDKFSTLPARRNKKRVELPLETRRRSVEIGPTSDESAGTPRPKKKALERSVSDASSHKSKSPLAKLFSPKLERKSKQTTVKRSASDAGASSSSTTGSRNQRKRSGSESESSHQNGSSRAKKPLSPIIEASPQVDKPFDFSGKSDATKTKCDAEAVVEDKAEESRIREIYASKPPKSPRRQEVRVESTLSRETATTSLRRTENKATKEEDGEKVGKDWGESSPVSPTERRIKVEVDEVDRAAATTTTTVTRDMLHSSRYDQQHGDNGRVEESTIHKMIHRLTADRSPPPQLTRTMVSPGPGFGHNNNRPFSYTRPNNNNNETISPSPPHQQTSVIYAQVQLDKKSKAQRSHSDSDEGLGLERKDSSRENSPAEKEYRRTAEYAGYGSDLRRNNEINSFKSSRYVEEVPSRKNVTAHFTDTSKTNSFATRNVAEPKSTRRHEFDEINRNLFDKPAEKYTSTVFVDTSGRGTADGMDSRRRENVERFPTGGQNGGGLTSKTSELSARRDLLESRIKSRLHNDDMFARGNGNPPKKIEHGIIDKPIVPSPITPDRVASPKRYTDTYITETRTNSNGEKYIFEKEIHEDNGKVYGYEKKITNKIPADVACVEAKPRDGYTVETRTDKYGDKYIVETRTHEGYADGFKPFLSDKSRNSPEGRFQAARNGTASPYKSTNYIVQEVPRHPRTEAADVIGPSSPIIVKKMREHKFSKSEDFLDREARPTRDAYVPKTKKNFESIRGMSKSTQRLDEVGENSRVKALRSEYITRSHENLSTADYVNARDMRRPLASPTIKAGRKERSSTLVKRHLEDLRERPNDDYDTDISQMTNSQLESSKYYKETRTTQRYSSGKQNLNDEYDSSPPRIRNGDRGGAGYNSSRYDSDTTARDSVRCEARYVEESSRTARKDHHGRKPQETDLKKPLRRSRNRLDYFDDSDARDSPRGKHPKERLETFDESPTMAPRVYHESKIRHTRHETRGHVERRHRETRLSDPDRKDRLADSGIENDYRRDSQEADRREPLESEDEGFVTLQFIKHERRHTDRNMNMTPSEKRKYDKYVSGAKGQIVSSKPPTGAEKKYEKKVAKKSGTMSKVKQLFSKKEKKAKEEKSKGKGSRSGSSGALTDDEVTMRYREYRGDQLRSARSARDLESDINQEDYSQRRRLSTPSGSPSPPRPARLSRSTGTLTREEEPFCELSNTLTRENQSKAAERKGWFKSLSRKNKSSAKTVDKKPRIPESEILTTGTEDEEASSAPERVSVQKNLRFFGETDQESVSSNRERRSKRTDDNGTSRRDVTSSSRQNLNVSSPPRKPPRLAESALSSGESTTGDSSQQSQNSQRSQRSVVYLHAATVGEIPGPNERRRAASRDELNRPLQSHTRTVSRSVSVLAPWKPRLYREPFEINYDQQQQQQQHQKPPTTMRRRQRSRETLSRRGKEPRRSKDNISKTGTISRSTLKSKDKQKADRTVSTESLASKPRNGSSRGELSRSTSVPRDPNKGAGWFKIKSKKSRA